MLFRSVEYAGIAGTAVIIGYGGWLETRDIVTIGTISAFVLYLNNLFEPINQLSQLYNVVQSAGAALTKVFGVLDTTASVAERPGSIDLPSRGPVAIDDVTFAYGDGPAVLRNVSLEVAPGERIALVGPTGAGKSTLMRLLSGEEQPDDRDRLLEPGGPLRRVGPLDPVGEVLRGMAADPDAELHAPAGGERRDRRHGTGEDGRVAVHHVRDERADRDPLGDRGGPREECPALEHRVVEAAAAHEVVPRPEIGRAHV